MDLGLQGRTAIVCAASRGLGRACAEALAAEGVALVLNARTAGPLEQTAETLRSKYKVAVTAVAGDIASAADRAALLAASIIGMFALGLAMKGKIYTGAQDILDMLGMVGDLGNGLLFFAGHAFGWGAEHVQVTTGDYGTKFIVVAGLLNVIAAVDAHNLRTGRKPL